MALKAFFKFLTNVPWPFLLRINKTTKELYRAGFVATAISEGVYEVLTPGPAELDEIRAALGPEVDPEGLRAWLDLGVSLGELGRSGNQYRVKGAFSKALLKNSNDTWTAFFRVRVDIFYHYITQTPALLKQGRRFQLNPAQGELYARSSRTVEPLLLTVVDDLIPRSGPCRLLEVGCGSGIYIQRACRNNPNLTALGLEKEATVAEFAEKNIKNWGLSNRVAIAAADIRDYDSETLFDVVTLHNLIYYFPLAERTDLLRVLRKFLSPRGRFILTTLCQGRDPSLASMNLWSIMNEGSGPLPHPAGILEHLQQAGFSKIHSQRLMPGFYLFQAEA